MYYKYFQPLFLIKVIIEKEVSWAAATFYFVEEGPDSMGKGDG